jgi:hypothetical protein
MGWLSIQPERVAAVPGAPDPPLTVRADARTLTVGVGRDAVVAWDRAGRLFSAWLAGHTWRRGLNGSTLHKWSDGRGRHRERAPAAAVDRLLDRTAALAARVRDGAADGPGRELLDRAARFDAAAGRADAARFLAIFPDVGILPPDQYLATLVQLTRGCSHGTCTFCDLYDAPFRVRTPREFGQHLAVVREFMNGSLALRGRSVFLGAANALALPASRLRGALDAIGDAFGGRPAVSSFVDALRGARHSAAEYRELGARGLDRVYIGLESGHDPLLAFVRKPGTSADAVETVLAIKEGGLRVGIVVLVGLGGDRFDAPHTSDTVHLLNAMPLGAGDIVYFSDLVDGGTVYRADATRAGLRALTSTEREAQRLRIRNGLQFAGAAPRLARYDVREFVY